MALCVLRTELPSASFAGRLCEVSLPRSLVARAVTPVGRNARLACLAQARGETQVVGAGHVLASRAVVTVGVSAQRTYGAGR